MEWSKLKNIIIIMLAAVNLFLLVLVVHRQWESRSSYESAREDALAVLWETSRIRLEREILPEELDLTPMSVTRDPELEETQAAALLGELTASPPEALRYVGAKGAAQFYVDGEFSAEVRTGAYPLAGAEPEEFAVDLLATIGFEAQVMSTEESGGETVVTLRQCWEGTPVFDRTAVLVFRDEELKSIQRNVSYRLTGIPKQEGTEQPMNLVTLLMRFVDYVNRNSRVCNEITGFTAGYLLDSNAQSDPALLIPAWYVTTDQGSYFWNAITGEITPEG